jgi:TetR/AcrR family transcriptional regulator, transcriptional repressor for nem operon
MRKSRQEAAETRRRIVANAAREFNSGGIERTGLSKIMTATGLTHGGFYKHFSSKNQLLTEAVGQAIEKLLTSLEGSRSTVSLDKIAAAYLSKQHRDDFNSSCPLAAVGTELRLAESDTRQVTSKGIERFISIVAQRFPDLSPKEANAKAHAIVSAMVGAMMLSRIVADKKLSDRLLCDTREFVAKTSRLQFQLIARK